ncbi:MAG: hypothetical protein R3D26_03415 [Cyanobacteriota/Melainabacteria group bacterium]
MLSSKENDPHTIESTRRASPVKYIIKFLLVWFLALPVIAAVALLSDINWTKPYVEKELSEVLHRDHQDRTPELAPGNARHLHRA